MIEARAARPVADGILLERAGVPAVSICTDPFVLTAGAMARSYGFPGFEYVTIPHPVACRAGQIRERARGLLPDLVHLGVE